MTVTALPKTDSTLALAAAKSFDKAVQLKAKDRESTEGRRFLNDLYYELLFLAVRDSPLRLRLDVDGLYYEKVELLSTRSSFWIAHLWDHGFRELAFAPGMEEPEVSWLVELCAEASAKDVPARAWAKNLPHIRFAVRALPPPNQEWSEALGFFIQHIADPAPSQPALAEFAPWPNGMSGLGLAPDPSLRQNLLKELQAETNSLLAHRLLYRLLEVFRPLDRTALRNHVEDLGWILWHFSKQPEFKAPTRLVRDLQEICKGIGLTGFGPDAPPLPPENQQSQPAAPPPPILPEPEPEPPPPAIEDLEEEPLLFQAYKNIKFTVTNTNAAPSQKETAAAKSKAQEGGFGLFGDMDMSLGMDSPGEELIDQLFGTVFGDEDAPQPATPSFHRAEQPAAPKSMSVEEETVDLEALGFDVAELQRRNPSKPLPPAPTPECVREALAMKAQGRLAEARNALYLHLKEKPADRKVQEELQRTQKELRSACMAQLQDDQLVPRLELQAGGSHHKSLLQAPAGPLLKRIDGAVSLKTLRQVMGLPRPEFDKHLLGLLEWGFVTLQPARK